jgi:hypothetical protein
MSSFIEIIKLKKELEINRSTNPTAISLADFEFLMPFPSE